MPVPQLCPCHLLLLFRPKPPLPPPRLPHPDPVSQLLLFLLVQATICFGVMVPGAPSPSLQQTLAEHSWKQRIKHMRPTLRLTAQWEEEAGELNPGSSEGRLCVGKRRCYGLTGAGGTLPP